MSDLISRQAIKEKLNEICDTRCPYNEPTKAIGACCGSCFIDDVIEMVQQLPSAEQKAGKWLYDKYYLIHVCSECDEQALEEYTVNPRTLDRDYDEVLSEYCPHCGSRMLEIEDEDEEDEEADDD